MLFWTVAALIFVALAFDYINGFHDAANSIATVVSTRVLSPCQAVIWAAVAKAGFAAIIASGWTKTIVFIFLSPLIGLVLGFAIMTSIMWIFRWMPPSRVDRWFRKLQLLSAAAFSLNHGANDAQKTMGI